MRILPALLVLGLFLPSTALATSAHILFPVGSVEQTVTIGSESLTSTCGFSCPIDRIELGLPDGSVNNLSRTFFEQEVVAMAFRTDFDNSVLPTTASVSIDQFEVSKNSRWRIFGITSGGREGIQLTESGFTLTIFDHTTGQYVHRVGGQHTSTDAVRSFEVVRFTRGHVYSVSYIAEALGSGNGEGTLSGRFQMNPVPAPSIPEPSAALLFMVGLVVVAISRPRAAWLLQA